MIIEVIPPSVFSHRRAFPCPPERSSLVFGSFSFDTRLCSILQASSSLLFDQWLRRMGRPPPWLRGRLLLPPSFTHPQSGIHPMWMLIKPEGGLTATISGCGFLPIKRPRYITSMKAVGARLSPTSWVRSIKEFWVVTSIQVITSLLPGLSSVACFLQNTPHSPLVYPSVLQFEEIVR